MKIKRLLPVIFDSGFGPITIEAYAGQSLIRTGRGGPEIKLETLTGDILIARRSKSSS